MQKAPFVFYASNNRLLAFILMFFLLGGCAAAARILYPLELDPLKAKPGVYSLDPAHANIIFSLNHLGFSLHHGRFNRLEGSLSLESSAPETSSVFISVQTGSIDTNNTELDDLLRGKAMFDVAAFPAATFQSTRVIQTGEKTAIIDGVLTIKGYRKPIQIEAEFIGGGTNPLTGLSTVGFSGKTRFKRSDFGLKSWLGLVGDEVTLIIEAEFIRAPG